MQKFFKVAVYGAVCTTLFVLMDSDKSIAQTTSKDRVSVDQYTWDLIEALAVSTNDMPSPDGLANSRKINRLHEIEDVSIGNVTLAGSKDASRYIQSLRVTAEVFDAANCTDVEQSWKRDIVTTNRDELTISLKNTVATTEKSTIDFSASLFGAVDTKASFSKEEKVEISNNREQTFFSEEKITISEERKIPKNTRLIIRVVSGTKTTAFPIEGRAIVDAKIRYHFEVLGGCASGPCGPISDLVSLSDPSLLPQPKHRVIDLNADATLTETNTIDIVYREVPLSKGDAICSAAANPDLKVLVQ